MRRNAVSRTIAAAPSRLLDLYPRAWRARYGDEFAALLEDCSLTPFVLIDIVLGALDAHLAPQDTTGRILHMLNRSRRGAITVFCAYIAFVVAGLAFNQDIEDGLPKLIAAHPDLAIAYYTVAGGAVVALLAVLVGGLPIALAVLRRAWAARRWDIFLLFAVPPVALAIWAAWTWVLLNVIFPANRGQAPQSSADHLYFVSWVGIFVLAAIASAAAVSVAIARSEVSARLYRFALAPAAVATVAMLVMLGGAVAWGLLANSDVPGYLAQGEGVFHTSALTYWLSVVVVMALATLVAAIALVRGYRAPGDDAPDVALGGA
ncbi:MAG TPA: hypothetical protein VGN32_13640 [Ktedonobacterales bacterium]|nr:hypothetical protein [Ktedonobacterales bacterium]